MLLKPVVYDGSLQRQLSPGDIVAGGEQIVASSTSTAITVTAALMAQGIFLRNPSGAATDTIDTAANIIAGLASGLGSNGIQSGTTFRLRWINTNGTNAVTVAATANTGVTVNRGTVALSTAKEFLVTVNNGTPAQTFQANTTSGSAVVSGLTASQLALLSPGMVVTNAVNGLQGTTILAVNMTAGTVTLSGNANATSSSPVTISFSPVITLDGLSP